MQENDDGEPRCFFEPMGEFEDDRHKANEKCARATNRARCEDMGCSFLATDDPDCEVTTTSRSTLTSTETPGCRKATTPSFSRTSIPSTSMNSHPSTVGIYVVSYYTVIPLHLDDTLPFGHELREQSLALRHHRRAFSSTARA